MSFAPQSGKRLKNVGIYIAQISEDIFDYSDCDAIGLIQPGKNNDVNLFHI